MQKKFSGFDSNSSIGSLSVCGRFAASVFPTVVKYVLKVFTMSVLSVQGISVCFLYFAVHTDPFDILTVSRTLSSSIRFVRASNNEWRSPLPKYNFLRQNKISDLRRNMLYNVGPT